MVFIFSNNNIFLNINDKSIVSGILYLNEINWKLNLFDTITLILEEKKLKQKK